MHIVWFLLDLQLINLYVMFFDQDDLYLTFSSKMVTATKIIYVFLMHLNIIKQHILWKFKKDRLGNTTE